MDDLDWCDDDPKFKAELIKQREQTKQEKIFLKERIPKLIADLTKILNDLDWDYYPKDLYNAWGEFQRDWEDC